MNQKVFCLGHISADIFINRKTLENLRLGGCIATNELTIHGGGDAANVAYWLGILKSNVSFVGVIGNDPTGSFLRQELEEANVECWLKISNKNTSATILIVIEESGERSFIINGESQKELLWSDLPLLQLKQSELFFTSGYTIEEKPTSYTVIRLIKELSTTTAKRPKIMFNLAAYTTIEKYRKVIDQQILPHIDILVGNEKEYETLMNENLPTSMNGMTSFLEEIRTTYPNLELILLTAGARGCYYDFKGEINHILAPSIDVIDSTGAGDGFCAGFINGFLNRQSIKNSIILGIKLGSHICQGYSSRYNPDHFLKTNKK